MWVKTVFVYTRFYVPCTYIYIYICYLIKYFLDHVTNLSNNY